MRKDEQLPRFPPAAALQEPGPGAAPVPAHPQCPSLRCDPSRPMMSSYQPIAALMYENTVFPYILMPSIVAEVVLNPQSCWISRRGVVCVWAALVLHTVTAGLGGAACPGHGLCSIVPFFLPGGYLVWALRLLSGH